MTSVRRWLSWGDIYLDHKNRPRVAIHQKKFSTKIYVKDPKSSNLSTHWEFDNRSENVVEPLGFSRDGYLYAARYENNIPVIKKFNIDVNDKKGILVGMDEIDNVHGSRIFDKEGILIGLRDAVSGSDYYFEKELASLQAKLDKSFPEYRNEILDTSLDYDSYIFSSSSINDPGTIYFGRASASEITPFAKIMRHVDKHSLPVTKSFHLSGADSGPVFELTLPAKSQKPAPLLILFDTLILLRGNEFSKLEKFYAKHGFAVLKVMSQANYGSNRRIYWPLAGTLDAPYLESVRQAYKYVESIDEVDTGNTCALGVRLQGYFALRAVADKSANFTCGVFFEPIADPEQYLKKSRFSLFVKQLFNSQADDIAQRSPIRNIDKFNLPMLLIREIDPGNAYSDETKRFYKKLKRNNNSAELLEVDMDEGATFRDENLSKIHSAMVEYLKIQMHRF